MNKVCKDCNIEKDILEFNKHKKYKGGYVNLCKVCEKGYRKNNDMIQQYKKEYNKKYNKQNKDILNEYHKRYQSNRKKEPIYKLTHNIRALIGKTFKNNGYKKDTKTYNILGCSFGEFKIYLENKFEDWMTWDNYGTYTGNYNETWQIDHIIAISNASNEEEVIKLNHYTNLQPLCSKINQYDKRNK